MDLTRFFRPEVKHWVAWTVILVEREKSKERREREMAGLMVFKSLADALRAGYQVYDRTADGYLVRTRTAAGWAMALVSCK